MMMTFQLLIILLFKQDELQKELEELEQEELDKELLNTGKTPVTDLPIPVVPTSEPSGRGKSIIILLLKMLLILY